MKRCLLLPRVSVFVIVSILAVSCKVPMLSDVPNNFPSFYKEGHRGARGLMPENTVGSMYAAIDAGANVIEVDVYTSKDGQVIVTHDHSVNSEHTLTSDGKELSREAAQKLVFHQMDYKEIRKLDVGLKYYKAFPQQKKIAAYVPLLSELIDSVETYTKSKNLPKIIYNIELKSSVKNDNINNAGPEKLVDAVMGVIKQKNIGQRYYIQSFDFRPLQYLHKAYPKVVIGFLTSSSDSFEKNIAELGFVPHIYSPSQSLVTPELIVKCHTSKTRIVPWTVNTREEMERLIKLGVDGIITDYPNYLSEVLDKKDK